MADGPWTEFQKKPAVGEEQGPWTEFQQAGKPPAVPGGTPAAPAPPASWGEAAVDYAKAVPRGIRQGYEGLAGLGGDVYNMEVSGAGKLAKWLGASPETLAEIEATRGQRASFLPTSQEVREKVTDPVLGEAGDSTTRVGKVLQRAASLIPGMGSTSFTRAVVAPTAGMEAGEAIGKRYGHGDLGAFLGGIAGGIVPGATTKGITRNVDPERAAQVRTLDAEGIPLTGGQASGSKALQYLEVGPFEGKSAEVAGQQGEAFSRANLSRADITANRATPEVMHAAQENFGRQYEDLIARSGGAALDSPLQTELLQTVDDFHRLKGLPQDAPTAVNGFFQRISDAARDNGGVIAPDTFRVIRSDIARNMKTSADPEVRQALGQLQDSLFDSIGRNGPPEIAAQWRQVNNNYRNFKTIEKAMGGTGEDTSRGLITPSKMARAVEAGDKTGWVQGRGDFNDLARAGEGLLKPLPQSGSMARAMPYVAAGAVTQAGNQLMSGHSLAALGTLAATALPYAGSKILTSRPVRTSIVREAAGQPLPLLDPITAALIARQNEQGGGR